MQNRLEFKVSYHQVDKSTSVEDFIKEKMETIFEKYDKVLFKVSWTCLKEHDSFIAKVTIKTTNKSFHFDHESDSIFTSIAECTHKLDHELSKQKDKKSHIHSQKSLKSAI